MRIIYDARNYDAPLPQFIDGLSVYLDSILPKRNASNIWHYKSYTWVKYKLDYEMGEYKDKQQLIYIDIWYIVRLSRLAQTKRSIIEYVAEKKNKPV
jgi:hypothetical protein